MAFVLYISKDIDFNFWIVLYASNFIESHSSSFGIGEFAIFSSNFFFIPGRCSNSSSASLSRGIKYNSSPMLNTVSLSPFSE